MKLRKQGVLQQNQCKLQTQGKLQKHGKPGSAAPALWCSGARSDGRFQESTLTKPVNWPHPRVSLACLQAKLAPGRTPPPKIERRRPCLRDARLAWHCVREGCSAETHRLPACWTCRSMTSGRDQLRYNLAGQGARPSPERLVLESRGRNLLRDQGRRGAAALYRPQRPFCLGTPLAAQANPP